ncbi:BglG family transcription antiterminator [Haloimpatiens sp. FM7315]|uniref:BglG family transcription antiterminator n=1 Tax=Haloimpatiens sp. FM7315 TaxID=3298609 RepID=UPI0039774AF9
MILNARSIAILMDLVKAEDYLKVSYLSSKYKITERAIRYNLDKIEKFLVKNKFEFLLKDYTKGVKLVKSKNLVEFVKRFKGEYTPYKYVYSKEEKIIYTISELLQSKTILNAGFFEKKLYISKNTFLKDLDIVDKYLKDNDLELIRKPRVGIYIDGSEEDKRRVLKKLASKTIGTKDIYTYINGNRALSKINNLQFDVLFSNIDLDYINGLIVSAERELDREFDDEAYCNLITHIAIMIKRIQLNKNIYLPEMYFETILKTKEYKITKKMINNIENHYNIKIPDEEIGYISLRFLGSKVLKDEGNENKYELYNVTKEMVEEIEKIYNVDFGEKKSGIIDTLIMHLRPAVYRVKFNLQLQNPIFEEILNEYKDLFSNTKYVVRHLEKYIGSNVSDEEVSYITLHFGAALENAKSKIEVLPKVILVCGTGIGTAKMLETQLKKRFNVDIQNTVSSRAIHCIEKDSYDYIISTIDIPELNSKQYIKVNALLLKRDYEILKKYFNIKYVKENKYDICMNKVNQLIDVVSKNCEIKDIYKLQYEFMNVLMDDVENFKENKISVMNDLLSSNFIKLKVNASNWKEAISEGVKVLENNKCVKRSYYDAIIENLEKGGPYMVVAKGVVLSHASPESGVLKLSMSLITLKEPVDFGDDFKEGVRIIVTLAATDKESHLKVLAQLMKLFHEKKDLKKLKESSTKEKALDIINKYSDKNIDF